MRFRCVMFEITFDVLIKYFLVSFAGKLPFYPAIEAGDDKWPEGKKRESSRKRCHFCIVAAFRREEEKERVGARGSGRERLFIRPSLLLLLNKAVLLFSSFLSSPSFSLGPSSPPPINLRLLSLSPAMNG